LFSHLRFLIVFARLPVTMPAGVDLAIANRAKSPSTQEEATMKRQISLLALSLLLAAGCGKPTDSAKPVSSDPGKGAVASTEHLGNKIQILGSPITVEKGKTGKLIITATRKDEDAKETAKETKKESVMYKVSWYQGEIKLEFDTNDVPQGATGLKFDPAVIPAGKDSIEVPVTAAADATSGMVGVTGKGGPGTEPFQILIRVTVR
jgi:hypothetical protein